MSGVALVVNSGSSSLKYQVVDAGTGEALAAGLIERIGQAEASLRHTAGEVTHRSTAPVGNHTAAIAAMLAAFDTHGPHLASVGLEVVGHRVVQGGSRFDGPVLIDEDVIEVIESLSDLAPLHNPANLDGIGAARAAFPNLPHVAVFDTAFHQTIPDFAYTYALDRGLATEHQIRRYGFHGTSHSYVSRTAIEHLGLARQTSKVIVAHLGNGASITAVAGGKSVDTSMGMTPLEGLVMGTRSGDLDPAITVHLARTANMSIGEIDQTLNRRSGMVGLSGHSDMRDVQAAIARGDDAARLALEVYCYRLRKYIGAYAAVLGGVDAVVFTAGVGENVPAVRAGAVENLGYLGIELDSQRNEHPEPGIARISADSSDVAVLVVPTDEELEITTQAFSAIGA